MTAPICENKRFAPKRAPVGPPSVAPGRSPTPAPLNARVTTRLRAVFRDASRRSSSTLRERRSSSSTPNCRSPAKPYRAKHHSGLSVVHEAPDAVDEGSLSGRKGHSDSRWGAFAQSYEKEGRPARLMAMHVTVLVPDIHDRPTGGNIYNRRIITELRKNGAVEGVSWRPETESVPSPSRSGEEFVVVDSLLVGADTPLRALRTAHPSATLVLLAHYLHCIDPNERDTAAADAERAALPLFDGVVTTSRYAQQAVVEAGVPPARTGTVPPGLDDAYRAPVPERPDRDPPRLLTVANLLPGKGLRPFVDVLATLTDLDWSWTLVGDDTLDPDFATALRDRIRASPIADRVTCTGAVSRTTLRAQYDRANVFVLPSRFETCSMATREAMARGCPVVGHAVGGLPHNLGEAASPSETVSPGETAAPSDAPAGQLVPPGQPAALAEALRRLLTDAARRTRMGTAARERSRSFPTWDEAGARFRSVLQAVSPPAR